MPYPYSPFNTNLNISDFVKLQKEETSNAENVIQNRVIDILLKWLCTTPTITSIRVNTLKTDVKSIVSQIHQHFHQNHLKIPKLYVHPMLQEVIIIEHIEVDLEKLPVYEKEVIIDSDCGAAVLRGSHIFAPGVLGLMSGTSLNERVSIYVDLARKCKKGLQKKYDESKVFIGNGIVKLMRHDLYADSISPSGVAIEVTETVSGCSQISESIFPEGHVLLQNLPSIICVDMLDPKPGETVLDMCASPGNKTTHIAAKMNNKGVLIAIDKTPTKVKRLQKKCEQFDAKAEIFEADSTKIFSETGSNIKPPFCAESFDKILLDAPCSALGKRPQFYNNTTERVLKSYVPLQRKLFKTAVQLLKINGRLVYSTCTITTTENEEMVRWALENFKGLQLVPISNISLSQYQSNDEVLQKCCRFGPNQTVDSVGFFMACFTKIKPDT